MKKSISSLVLLSLLVLGFTAHADNSTCSLRKKGTRYASNSNKYDYLLGGSSAAPKSNMSTNGVK